MEYQIDDLLKKLAQIYIQNPSLPISKDTIYYYLSIYGLTDDEIKNDSIRDLFSAWENRFSESKNLKVYVSLVQTKFLQFRNKNQQIGDGDFIKVYLSFSRDNIEFCVNKIFDFIDKNNICSFSKVAHRIRSDAVVLRLGSIEDAKKVLHFVNSDADLVRCSKPTNPFLIKEGICGVAYDKWLSYNRCVSVVIAIYLNALRKENSLDNVSYDNFKQYLNSFYRNTFINQSNLKEFMNNVDFGELKYRFDNEGEHVLNWKQIIELLMAHINNVDINQYFELYSKFKKENASKELMFYYNDIITNNLVYSKKNLVIDDNKRALLDEYIKFAMGKYSKSILIATLQAFIEDTNYDHITRSNDLRKRFVQYNITGTDIKNLVNDDLRIYIDRFYLRPIIQNDVQIQSSNLDNKRALLDEYIKFAMGKYSKSILISTLQAFIGDTNYDHITRSNFLRKRFVQYNIIGVDIKNLVNDDLRSYVDRFYQNCFSNEQFGFHDDNEENIVFKYK